ncbi:hypothetical protein [Mucilaginibacter flavus]|uniref:hypothetical protein n=1 Tax=Mucilaginibacter flavus TaxID=931504 RepID=UPI0025B3A59A|nr:hypothetical protein [Mucilaginibacter flavus]MDN3582455.1 hypothetical protein [Mucilaginibacter flavus]
MTIKIALITFVVAAIGFSSCKPNQQSAITDAAPGAINVDTLTYETALRYVKNYEKHAGTVDSLDSRGGKHKNSNSRCIWFSLARMDSLVQRVRREGGDGVRLYLATYDSTYKIDYRGHKPDKKYWGYNTLVMVSTKDSVGAGDSLTYHADYYKKKKKPGQNGGPEGFIIGNPPENRGEQCPPPVTCSSIGATLIK